MKEQKIVRRSFTERSNAVSKGQRLLIEQESHIIRDLCLLSPESRNGRTYTPEAMQDAIRLYEGMPCYQDHPDDPEANRSTSERLGRWQNIRMVEGKIRGDLHYDPNHPYAKSLLWAATECPDHCGVSHNVEAEGYDDDNGHFTVTRMVEARSGDIVDDPATNQSLLESTNPKARKRLRAREAKMNRRIREGAMDPELPMEDDDMDMDGGETPEHHIGKFISAVCDDPNLDKAAKRKKINKALDLYDEGEVEEEHDDEEEEPMMAREEEEDEDIVTKDPEDKRGKPSPQEKQKDDQYHREIGVGESRQARESLQKLRKHKDQYVRLLAESVFRGMPPRSYQQSASQANLGRHPDATVRAMARRLDVLEAEKIAKASVQKAIAECRAAGLPKRVMSQLFIEDLAECTDPRRRRAMIQERAHLASISLPRSYAPGGRGAQMSSEEFAAMVNGGAE